MKDEQLQQRIKYLVEHGGLWDDPLADIRRNVRWAIGIGALALLTELIHLLR
jgi:hypothetical protein